MSKFTYVLKQKTPKEATGDILPGQSRPGFPEATAEYGSKYKASVTNTESPAERSRRERNEYDDEVTHLRRELPGSHTLLFPHYPPKRRQTRSAPAIVDSKKEYGPPGMGLYDTGVEKVREKDGDKAAEAARKDMAHADFMRARKKYGEMESSSDDHYERIETGDDQTWLVNKDTGEVARVTGMSDEDVDRAYYPETQPEAL